MKAKASGASTCSLSRWPTIEEVKANYLTEGVGWAYAVVEGFRDYGPVVAQFYIVRAIKPGQVDEVWVDFPCGPAHGPASAHEWDDGQSLQFLCRANS